MFYTCAMEKETKEFKTDSSVCGYYVYQENRMLVIREQLVCERKEGD